MTLPTRQLYKDKPNTPGKTTILFLLLALLPCVAPRLKHPLPAMKDWDFNVYYFAAALVSHGHGSLIYTGADDGSDPQTRIAGPGTPIDLSARSEGVTNIGYYLYPPLLADMLVPLTHLGLRKATRFWLVFNLFLVLGTAVCLSRLLNTPLIGIGSAVILIGAFCYSPIIDCLSYGQVTVLLLFLWSLATTCYAKGCSAWAGAIFALAAVIKLTPAIVLLPLIFWRKWHSVIAFLITASGLFLSSLYFNTPAALSVYLNRVVPAMSRSIPRITNISISSGTQLLITALHGGRVFPDPYSLPYNTVLAGKIVSLCFTVAMVAVVVAKGRKLLLEDQVLILALLALISPVISPVSWLHAYATGFIAFALLWAEALRAKTPYVYQVFLLVNSIIVGSYAGSAIVYRTAQLHHEVLTASLDLFRMLALCGLIFYRLSTTDCAWEVLHNPASTGVIA